VTPPPQRLKRALAAFLRQELGAPVATIIGLTEYLLEDARQNEYDSFMLDLGRIHTAGHQLQAQLERLVDVAVQNPAGLSADLTAFKTKLRHDLRTPLNAVKGYSELIMEEARDAGLESLCKEVGKLLAAAEQLLGQVDTLIDLSGAEERRSPGAPPPAAMPPRDLVGQIMQSIQPVGSGRRREPGPSSRILVVDDTAANRELLSRRLTRAGHVVDVVEGGRPALARLAEAKIDLVLLDLMMPDMNGYEVLRLLKADPALRHIPVIVISALDEIDSIVRCIEAGAEDYLPKPFDPVLLNARINASLERKRLRDREQAFANQLRAEKDKSDALLLNILPATIVERMRCGEVVIADRFPEATILFSDLVGFTTLASRLSPSRVVELLNDLFSMFDHLAMQLGLEKIKTIGDAYMVAAGLPQERSDHAIAIADMALGMIGVIEEIGRKLGEPLEIRVGVHSGEVVAGIIGSHKFIYDVWGDTVNIASRMESSGVPNQVHISAETYRRLGGAFRCRPRGPVELKGRGTIPTYFLDARRDRKRAQ
jgi:adenylate cyclase